MSSWSPESEPYAASAMAWVAQWGPQPGPGNGPASAERLAETVARRSRTTGVLWATAAVLVCLPVVLLVSRPAELSTVPVPEGVLQCVLGAVSYVVIRPVMAPWARRRMGAAAIILTPDRRVRVLRGMERVEVVASMLRHPVTRRREVIQTLATSLAVLAALMAWQLGATALFGTPVLVLAGAGLAGGCDVARGTWWLQRQLGQGADHAVEPTILLPIIAGYLVASGVPFPVEGVNLAGLHECLRRHPELAALVRGRIEMDAQYTSFAMAAGGVGGAAAGLDLWFG